MIRRDRDGLHRRPAQGGNWYFYVRDPLGRLREQSTRTSNYAEAKDIRNRELARLREMAIPSDRAECTFAKAARAWLKQRELDGRAPNTMRLARERLVPLLGALGSLKLRQVATPSVLLAYKEKRLGEVSPRTFNMERSVMRGILRWARLWHVVEDDLTAAREADHGPGHALEPSEEARLLAAAREPGREFILNIYLLARNTGLRRGELLSLRLADIDLQGRWIHVPKSKTDAGVRSVPLNERALEAVRWLRHRAGALGAAKAEHYLLPAPVKGGYDPKHHQKSFRSAWRSLTRAAGLKAFRSHDLRHTFLSDLGDQDCPDEVAMSLAGHRGVEALRTYQHLRRSARERRNAEKRQAVAAILKNASGNQSEAAPEAAV